MAIAEISVDELEERLAEGARLVDVRQPYEFDEAHVAGRRARAVGRRFPTTSTPSAATAPST